MRRNTNQEINEKENMKQPYIFEIADVLNEGPSSSEFVEFQTQLVVNEKKKKRKGKKRRVKLKG